MAQLPPNVGPGSHYRQGAPYPPPNSGPHPPQGQPYPAPYPPQGQGYPPQPPGYPPQGHPYPAAPPPPPPARSKLRWIIPVVIAAALVIALVAVGGVVLVLRAGDKKKPPAPAGDGGTTIATVQREGYTNLEDSVADPAALVEKLDNPPVTFAGGPVIAACSLLTLADLKGGLLLRALVLKGAYRRSYFTGEGTAPVDRGSDYFVPISPPNSCAYVLVDGSGVTIDVLQESYTNRSAIRYESKDFQERPAIGAVTVQQKSTRPLSDTSDYAIFMLQIGRTAVRATLTVNRGPRVEQVRRELLETIAANLEKRSASPIGTPSVTYNSPLFKDKVASACDLFDAQDFQTLFHRPPAPFVYEELSNAVGRINYSLSTDGRDKNDYAYLQTECIRSTGEGTSTRRTSLKMDVTTYTVDTPAKYDMSYAGRSDGATPLSRTVADESYAVTHRYTKSAGSLVFRKGRFVVTLTLTEPTRPGGDPMARAERLVPVAEQIAARLDF